VVPSDAPWRYRRKLTLHLRRSGNEWIAGLHPYDDPVGVFDLADCPITDERVVALWRELRGAFEELPAESALRVAVRLLEDGAAATVEGGQVWRTADAFFTAAPSLTELWWRPDGGSTRRVASRIAESRAGAAFVQVNARVAARVQADLLGRIRVRAPGSVIDAYAGSGATAIPLAEGGTTVTAIELDRAAVDRMRPHLHAPSSAIAGRVEDHLERALPADVVILNPPRAGVDVRVTDALERHRATVRALFYVSCDPATLGRDLARLPGYRLLGVRGYDMFPQTAHVETLCELEPVQS
jgi:23S rRNA (uracil1939-C5)-methyltransferase